MTLADRIAVLELAVEDTNNFIYAMRGLAARRNKLQAEMLVLTEIGEHPRLGRIAWFEVNSPDNLVHGSTLAQPEVWNWRQTTLERR